MNACIGKCMHTGYVWVKVRARVVGRACGDFVVSMNPIFMGEGFIMGRRRFSLKYNIESKPYNLTAVNNSLEVKKHHVINLPLFVLRHAMLFQIHLYWLINAVYHIKLLPYSSI